MVTAVETLYHAGKLVCADCHGPYALIDCKKARPDPTKPFASQYQDLGV